MRFRLLGRLEVTGDGGVVALPGAVPRAILGRLLLARGDVVRRDILVDDIWEEREAKDPVNALQVQMAKLRAAFAAKGEEGRLPFRHGGYQIVLGPQDDVDVQRFEAAVQDGRKHLAAREHQQAELRLRLGLAQWRGGALEDLAGRVFQGERSRLEELRLSVLEDAAFAALELGRAEELVAELTALISKSPLRERSRARLMLALYRSGRQAEALEVYEAGRKLLSSELGVSPSLELRELHSAILRHDASVQAPSAAQALAPPASPPRSAEGNLARPLGVFVGRRGEVDAVRGRKRRPARQRTAALG
jgi:DNA-binding SARP family transcriptional activator